jgi:hypothetical protein
MKVTIWGRSILADPRSKASLEDCPADGSLRPIGREGFKAPQFGVTSTVFANDAHAYPVVEGFPALMWPEVLLPAAQRETADLRDRRFAEAYAEMEHYNPIGRGQAANVTASHGFQRAWRLKEDGIPTEHYPDPVREWIDGCFDIEALVECSRYIAPVRDKTALQIGGSGDHVIRLLLAGASEAVLVTPMIGEAELAWAIADRLGLSDRFSCVLGIGEELPIRGESVDVVTSQGCLHHTRLELALPEIHRVLKVGGRFSAIDPWRAPLYGLGTKMLGKRGQKITDRSQSIFCNPLTAKSLSTLGTVFPNHVISNHGPLLRYPLLALDKFGIHFSAPTMFRLARLDDRIGQFLHIPASWGGSMMFGGERT